MPEAREVRSVVEAAEQAAAADDYASAERLLREAADLQQASLGPLHPDLANTLNNLGVLCDITQKPADAELCYRRAYAIATAVLPPDHPFVGTSRKNLEDFCKSQGKPFELPGKPVELPTALPVVAAGNERSLAIGALGACGILFVMFVVIRSWSGSDRRPENSSAPAPRPVPENPPRTPEPLPVAPAVVPKEIEPAVVPKEKTGGPVSSPALLAVADARLCKNLLTGESPGSPGDWHCDRASLPVDPGSIFFYTRVKSASDTTIQHRWYHGSHLQKAIELRVRASPMAGYRTYSRHVIDIRSRGDWRVELRTKDGTLLHEERFAVR